MFEFGFDFDAPEYLWLLPPAVLLIWGLSRRSISSLGAWRKWFALGLRLSVAMLLILALAEPNWVEMGRRLAVLFLVDGSASITQEEAKQAREYVNAAAEQRDTQREDRAGVIVFGRDAASEIPPLAEPWQWEKLETPVQPEFTNLAAALEMAQATLPADCAKRVVIISDGNTNLGNTEQQAERLLQAGVGVDVLPIRYVRTGDVVVEKIVAPTEILRGVPFDLRVVLNNASEKNSVAGKLSIMREASGARETVAEQDITLVPGKQVLTIRQQSEDSGFFTYEAAFFPIEKTADQHTENNRATAFSRVLGRGRVLLIENANQAGRFQNVIDKLKAEEIEVVLRPSVLPFDGLADLQQFDTVILADVPRFTSDDPAVVSQFTDEQIHTLVQNTERFGCGLVVLGGPNSFGAGGWAGTELEAALPVDFQIKNLKVQVAGALVLVIDSSGSMDGDKLTMSKAAAAETAKLLGPQDYLGVVAFDSFSRWVVPLQHNTVPENARRRIAKLQSGGGTDMMPGMKLGYEALLKVNSSAKHMIVLTDGQTPGDDFLKLARQMNQAGITTTGIAIGADADRTLLSDIARQGGGKFYHVIKPSAIPRVFMHEARRVALPLVHEDDRGFAPQVEYPGEMLAGIPTPFPSLTGYVMTTLKDSPLVELMLSTSVQPSPNNTILAAWQYGLGRSVALTTDVGQRWATSWAQWPNFDKLMVQMVRWSMRRSQEDDRLALSVDARDGRLRVVVTALDQDQTDLNFLKLSGTLVRDRDEAITVELEQTAPGRYVAEVPTEAAGNYYLAVAGSGVTAPLRAAISVPPTAEFADRKSNEVMLASLAERAPRGGEAGAVIETPDGLADTQGLLGVNVFRPGVEAAAQRTPFWPLALVLAAVLFWSDVFCRRVQVDLSWIGRRWNALRAKMKGQMVAAVDPRLERLKQRKSESAREYTLRDPAVSTAEASLLDDFQQSQSGKPAAESAPTTDKQLTPDGKELAADAASYIGRLQAAKKRAMRDRD